MITQEQNETLWKMIKGIKVAMLTSRDGEVLRSRPMHISQSDYSGKLWFFNRITSHKTTEMQADHAINVSFADAKDDTYVSLSGMANIVTDQAKIDELWNPMVAAWFPEGKDGDAVSLIEVTVNEAEYWDVERGAMRQLLEMARANIQSDMPDMGENKKFS